MKMLNAFSWIALVALQVLALQSAHAGDVQLEGATNFRDLGGYKVSENKTVRSGMIYRSAKLNGLTGSDKAKVSSLDITTIVDLRTTEERHSEPDAWPETVDVISTDYSFGDITKFFNKDMTGEQAEAMMAQAYRTMPQQQKDNYSKMFKALAEDDGALLFHCSAGKDRTGIASALVLTALGADHDVIMTDYLKTRDYLREIQNQHAGNAKSAKETTEEAADPSRHIFSQLQPEAIAALMDVRPVYLNSALDSMNEEYGSVMGYIQEGLGVSDEQLATIRSRYLQ